MPNTTTGNKVDKINTHASINIIDMLNDAFKLELFLIAMFQGLLKTFALKADSKHNKDDQFVFYANFQTHELVIDIKWLISFVYSYAKENYSNDKEFLKNLHNSLKSHHDGHGSEVFLKRALFIHLFGDHFKILDKSFLKSVKGSKNISRKFLFSSSHVRGNFMIEGISFSTKKIEKFLREDYPENGYFIEKDVPANLKSFKQLYLHHDDVYLEVTSQKMIEQYYDYDVAPPWFVLNQDFPFEVEEVQ